MSTWAEIKAQMRRSLLQDNVSDGEDPTWSDERLLDAFVWAQRDYAAHTSEVVTYSIVHGSVKDPLVPAVVWDLSTELTFPLPSDLYDTLDTTGVVAIIDSGGTRQYLDPVFYTHELSPYAENEGGFWTAPHDVLHLTSPAGAGCTLEVRYFAYWPEPADDDDVLTIPRWAIAPCLYMAAAHCLAAPGVASANIRQWNTRDDSGRPQDNALAIQADWLEARAETMLARHERQDRANFFRAIR